MPLHLYTHYLDQTTIHSTMASKPATTPPENKKPKKKPSSAAQTKQALISVGYDDPELKVVVRLLPPSLTRDQFLEQVAEKSKAYAQGVPFTRFYYQQGSTKVKPFEEPIFSRAYFQFQSRDQVASFKKELHEMSFQEPGTGDSFICQTMKSVFGAVADVKSAESLDLKKSEDKNLEKEINDPVYSRFLKERETNGAVVDLTAMCLAMQNKKKKKERLKLKKEQNKLKQKQTGELETVSKNVKNKDAKHQSKSTKTANQDSINPPASKKKPKRLKKDQTKDTQKASSEANGSADSKDPSKKPVAPKKSAGSDQSQPSEPGAVKKTKPKPKKKKKNPDGGNDNATSTNNQGQQGQQEPSLAPNPSKPKKHKPKPPKTGTPYAQSKSNNSASSLPNSTTKATPANSAPTSSGSSKLNAQST